MAVSLTQRGREMNISANFASPVDGVKVPDTAKSSKVASQQVVNMDVVSEVTTLPTVPSVGITTTTTTTITPTVPSITAESALSGAAIGTALTGTTTGGVIGAVVGGLSDCVPLPSFAVKLDSLEASLSGILPKLSSLPAISGLEALGDKIGDLIGAVSDEISGIVGGLEASISGFLGSIPTPSLPSLPSVDVALGLENIPCPDDISANQEQSKARADEAKKKSDKWIGYKEIVEGEIQNAYDEYGRNLDAQGIPYKIVKDGYKIPAPTMTKKEMIDWGIMPSDPNEYKLTKCRIVKPLIECGKKYPKYMGIWVDAYNECV
jgi:hypothetical protein